VVEAPAQPLREPGREVAGERRVAEQRLERRARHPARDEVLLHEHVEGGAAGDEAREAERLALLEDLDRLPVALEPDRAAHDDVQVLRGVAAAPQDPVARRPLHHVDRARHRRERVRRQRVERRRAPHERHGIERGHRG
jgi:hypothetical protein